jgi:hypothetical protein
MKTTHTYAIKSFGQVAATDYSVNVAWPETLDGVVEAVGKDRVYKLFTQFVAAHHVQSKIKGAFGAEKPSEDQKNLVLDVKAKVTLNGVDFIPAERGNGDDAIIKKLREADAEGKLTLAKIDELATRWGSVLDTVDDLEGLIEVYRQWKKSQKIDLGL